MRELGVVVATHRDSLIVKAKNIPTMESKVYDKSKKEIGYVKKIFGPVNSPYVEVKVTAKIEVLKYINQNLFVR